MEERPDAPCARAAAQEIEEGNALGALLLSGTLGGPRSFLPGMHGGAPEYAWCKQAHSTHRVHLLLTVPSTYPTNSIISCIFYGCTVQNQER